MKLCATAAIAIAVFLLSSVDAAKLVPVVRGYDALFARFKAKYGKTYATPLAEAKARRAYEDNTRWAAELSAQNPKATFGDTVYMDVPREEFKKTHYNADFTAMLKKRKPITSDEVSAGSQIDWRTKGAVTGVKNQMNCGGGGWAFAATGNIEGQWFIADNTLVSLSEQELLSCVVENDGCRRGSVDTAFHWLLVTQAGQIDTEDSYPFVSDGGSNPRCVLPGRTVGATIGNWVDLPQNESSIEAFLYSSGPVAVALDATSLHTYIGGIMTNCEFTHLNHAALIVGFDDTSSTPYWIIKNSWGASWGESGYFRVQKGTNQCGLNQLASSAQISSSGPTPPSPPLTQAPSAPTFTPNPLPPTPPSPPSSSSSGGPEPPSPPTPPTPPSSSSSGGPEPPSPPTPPTPPSSSSSSAGPAPSGNNFTFYLCQDDACSSCESYSLPQDTCIAEEFNGDSFKAKCVSDGYDLDVGNYDGVTDCSVEGQWQRVVAGTCYLNVDGVTYVKYYCPSN